MAGFIRSPARHRSTSVFRSALRYGYERSSLEKPNHWLFVCCANRSSRFQLETGLHYNWHRHYDPTTGRYIQADPLGMPDGPSRYAYVGNSPLMYVDREGLQNTPPPPANIPGGPWKWHNNPGDSRGGRWHGADGSSGNFDFPDGHWDIDDGKGNRQRYNRHGAPLSKEDAHGQYQGPPRLPIPRWSTCPPLLIMPPASAFCGVIPELCPPNRT